MGRLLKVCNKLIAIQLIGWGVVVFFTCKFLGV